MNADIDFYELGWAIGEALSYGETFEPIDFKAAKRRACNKGYPCKGACISARYNCRNPLEGQSKGFGDWIKGNLGKLTKGQKSAAKTLGINTRTGKQSGLTNKERLRIQKSVAGDARIKNAANKKPISRPDKPVKSPEEDRQKRAKILGELGDLENNKIPQLSISARKAKEAETKASSELAGIEYQLRKDRDFIGSQAVAQAERSIQEKRVSRDSAQRKAVEAEAEMKRAESQKNALTKQLKELPPPEIKAVPISQLKKALTQEEQDLFNAAQVKKGPVSDAAQRQADALGGIENVRKIAQDYRGKPDNNVEQAINQIGVKTDDSEQAVKRWGSQMAQAGVGYDKIDASRDLVKREIEVMDANRRAKALGLNDTEAAAIIAYTNNAYVGVNGYARGLSVNSNSATAKFQDIATRATYQAAAKLPTYEGEVKRGSRETESRIQELENAMKNGKTVTFDGFTSTSSKTEGDISGGYGKSAKEQAKSQTGLEKASEWQNLNNRADLLQWDATNLKGVEYRINQRSGRDISKISSQQKEQEVLLMPGTPFKVKSVQYDGEKAIVELEEDG